MSIEIVNTAPGTSGELLEPGRPTHFSLKSLGGSIILGSLRASLGISNLRLHGTLPELDPVLAPGIVSLAVPEHRTPQAGTAPTSITSNALSVGKPSNSQLDASVYELTYPVEDDASVMGYFRLKKRSWVGHQPDYCYTPGVVAPYLGLRVGPLNSGAFVFLQDDGLTGQLLVGGPLQASQQPRPAQQSFPFAWKSLGDGQAIEVWIFLNRAGLPPPYPSPYTPVIEVWKRAPSDPGPVRLTSTPTTVASLGAFTKQSTDLTATLFFGNGGLVGETVEFEDWALFPDYRVGAWEGNALPYNALEIRSDNPVVFRADDGNRFDGSYAGRWFESTDAGSAKPMSSFGYQPGRKLVPLTVDIEKASIDASGTRSAGYGHATFERYEPRLALRLEGFSVEAFLSGNPVVLDGDSFGAGFEVDDGLHRYGVVMVSGASRRGFALAGIGSPSLLASYYLSNTDSDFTSLKLVRLIVDRLRNTLSLYVDGECVFSSTLAALVLPTSVAPGRVRVGHVRDNTTQGMCSVASITYMPRYVAYESSDGTAPDTTVPTFVRAFSSGSSSSNAGALRIDRPNWGSAGRAVFQKAYDLEEHKSFYIEFGAKVLTYCDENGTEFAANSWVGPGVVLHFGNKVLRFGFFDCGVYGRMVGVITDSGSDQDILLQTDVGRRISGECDWTQAQSYRIICKPYVGIEVWVGSPAGVPLFTIPWGAAGMDLPTEVTSTYLEFGHLLSTNSSSSEWEFVRWGSGNGYEVSLSQLYPNGPKPYHLGGEVLLHVEIDEYADGSGIAGTGVRAYVHSILDSILSTERSPSLRYVSSSVSDVASMAAFSTIGASESIDLAVVTTSTTAAVSSSRSLSDTAVVGDATTSSVTSLPITTYVPVIDWVVSADVVPPVIVSGSDGGFDVPLDGSLG